MRRPLFIGGESPDTEEDEADAIRISSSSVCRRVGDLSNLPRLERERGRAEGVGARGVGSSISIRGGGGGVSRRGVGALGVASSVSRGGGGTLEIVEVAGARTLPLFFEMFKGLVGAETLLKGFVGSRLNVVGGFASRAEMEVGSEGMSSAAKEKVVDGTDADCGWFFACLLLVALLDAEANVRDEVPVDADIDKVLDLLGDLFGTKPGVADIDIEMEAAPTRLRLVEGPADTDAVVESFVEVNLGFGIFDFAAYPFVCTAPFTFRSAVL